MSRWLKFVGIVTIISAVPMALTIFGVVIAWLPIWLGVLLIQAGNAAQQDDERQLLRMVEKLKTYFIVQGLLILLAIAVAVLISIFFGAFFLETFEMMRQNRGPMLEAWYIIIAIPGRFWG